MLNIKKISPLYIPILYIYIHIPKLMLMVLIHILTTCRSFEGWIQSWTAWNLTRRARTSADAPIIGESLASSMWMDPFGSKKGGLDPGMKNLDLFVGPLQANARLAIEFPSSKAVLPWFIDKNDEEPIETRALIWFQWEMYVFGTRKSELTN